MFTVLVGSVLFGFFVCFLLAEPKEPKLDHKTSKMLDRQKNLVNRVYNKLTEITREQGFYVITKNENCITIWLADGSANNKIGVIIIHVPENEITFYRRWRENIGKDVTYHDICDLDKILKECKQFLQA